MDVERVASLLERPLDLFTYQYWITAYACIIIAQCHARSTTHLGPGDAPEGTGLDTLTEESHV